MSQKIRLFIAIDFPEGVKNVLLETVAQMGQQLPNKAVRWVKPEQMHLTLRFLGDTAVSQLPDLQNQLTQLTSQHSFFRLHLNDAGAFPNRERPRVVWAGLDGDLAKLEKMQTELEDRIVALGWSREKRPFSPHVTLGRVKDARQVQALNWDVDLAKMEFGVTAVRLVQSELRPSGAVYTVHHLAQLI
jgi:2'-5' RNA ligase